MCVTLQKPRLFTPTAASVSFAKKITHAKCCFVLLQYFGGWSDLLRSLSGDPNRLGLAEWKMPLSTPRDCNMPKAHQCCGSPGPGPLCPEKVMSPSSVPLPKGSTSEPQLGSQCKNTPGSTLANEPTALTFPH